MDTLDRYTGQRRVYPTVKRPGNPPLDTRYIRRKWLDVPYAAGCPRALMDIYLPNDGDGPFPVVLFIHGGGYAFGSKGDYETYPPLEGLKRGYAVCAIDYTLSGEAFFPRQIQEGKAAVRFIRANAAQYNLDPSCLIAWGMSAGANLAAMLATTGHQSFPELEDRSMGNPDQPHHVDACMIWFCPTNVLESDELLAELGLKASVNHRGLGSVWTSYFGIVVDEVPPELAALTNPESYVSPAAPPFVIQHGKRDTVVPYVQSVRFAEKLKATIGEDKVRLTLFDDYAHADRRFETMYNCSNVLDQLEELLGRG